jgi:hypothetical protein
MSYGILYGIGCEITIKSWFQLLALFILVASTIFVNVTVEILVMC